MQGWQVLPTGQFCPVKTMVLTGRSKLVLPGSQFCPAFALVLTGWAKPVLPMGKTWAKLILRMMCKTDETLMNEILGMICDVIVSFTRKMTCQL